MEPTPAELLQLAGSVVLCARCDAPVTTHGGIRRNWPALTAHRCAPNYVPEG